jgi:hypothetical protein
MAIVSVELFVAGVHRHSPGQRRSIPLICNLGSGPVTAGSSVQ